MFLKPGSDHWNRLKIAMVNSPTLMNSECTKMDIEVKLTDKLLSEDPHHVL